MAADFERARVGAGQNQDRFYRHSEGGSGVASWQTRQRAISGSGKESRIRHHEGAPGSGSLEKRSGEEGAADERRGAAQHGIGFPEALGGASAQHVRLPAGAAAEK